MKTKKRLLSILLSLVMVLGMMPGMSLTAYAAGTKTIGVNVTYAIGDSIVCNNRIYIVDNSTFIEAGTYTLSYSRYISTSKKHRFDLTTNSTIFIADTDATQPTGIKVTGGNGTQTNPYTFEVVHTPMEHSHHFTYSAQGAEIIATCDQNDCTLSENKVVVTIKAPENLICGDTSASHAATLEGEAEFRAATGIAPFTIYYKKGGIDGENTNDLPTGTPQFNTLYTAYISYLGISGVVASVSFTFTKQSYTVIYKVVNGTWSDDSTEDKTETVESGSKPASVPTGMKASDGYTGGAWDSNPDDATITGATTFTYTFTAKQAATVTKAPTAKTLSYTGTVQELVNAGAATGGTMQYALGENATTAPTTGYTTSIPTATNAGTYYVWYRAAGDANHNDTTPACLAVTIQPDSSTGSVKGNALTYTGTAQALVTEGTASCGKMLYALGENVETAPTEGWSETVPTGTDVKDYYVWYKVAGDENHNDSAPACVTVSIAKKDLSTYVLTYEDTKIAEPEATVTPETSPAPETTVTPEPSPEPETTVTPPPATAGGGAGSGGSSGTSAEEAKTTDNPPKTADNTPIDLMIMLLAYAALGVSLLIWKKVKRRNR